MSLHLSGGDLIARARADLRIGAPVAIASAQGGAIFLSAETCTTARLDGARCAFPDRLDLAVSHRRAETLNARAYDGDLARILLPADSGQMWILATADPSLDLSHPFKGPYRTRREGQATLHRNALLLCKQARLLPAALVAEWDDPSIVREIARQEGLTLLDTADVQASQDAKIRMHRVTGARVPTRFSNAGRVHVFRPDDGGEEHYAIEIGSPSRDNAVLSRLHSACFTGDVVGSLKCDCGPQLTAALEQISANRNGVLLYLNQEGRGIGLANKMRAYSLQDEGYDTVEANHRLGFEDDERDFRIGAEILKTLGFSSVRLMTNNPRKIEMMNASGVCVTERVPLIVGENDINSAYLATKAAKSGHLL